MRYSDSFLKDILTRTRRIAVVGASDDPARPSHRVAQYLLQRGYEIVPVNPTLEGQSLFDVPVVGSLAQVEGAVDMVDIFRRSEAVPAIVEEALAHLPGLRTVWMQIGVESAEATALCEAGGVDVVQNLCPKIEYQRLLG